MQNTPCYDVKIQCESPQKFEDILQRGFYVAFTTGCTLREFLCEQVGVCGDYAQVRIQTIFLNGQPVDDVDSTILKETDQLAFSAAMPGLVGATMRRGGYYASLRESISHHENDAPIEVKQGFIRVRLFNFLARELAETFLIYGIFVEPQTFATFLRNQSQAFFQSTQFFQNSVIIPSNDLIKEVEAVRGRVKLSLIGR